MKSEKVHVSLNFRLILYEKHISEGWVLKGVNTFINTSRIIFCFCVEYLILILCYYKRLDAKENPQNLILAPNFGSNK